MTINPKKTTARSTSLAHGITPLPDWGLILVEGPDAATLLQNQLSNSVLGLQPLISGQIAEGYDAVRLVGYCSPKGRLLATAWLGLYQQGSDFGDRFALFVSKDIAASTAKKLSMYILRSKVKITDVSHDWEISGLYQELRSTDSQDLRDESLALRLPDVFAQGKYFKRILMARARDEKERATENDENLNQWNTLEVLSAIPRIVLATREQFVPQMINFESVAGVDFKKGCYPGQEIVARSQYRGAVKRRLQLAHTKLNSTSFALSKPGVEIFHSSDANQPCGMVVLASKNPAFEGRIDLQIECKLEALDAGHICLGNSEGPVLKIDTLPYALLEI
jgi:tRNA-modifying protein YgfZ